MSQSVDSLKGVSFTHLRARAMEIIEIVAEHSSYSAAELKLSTAINDDLGIDGWDAWDILEEVIEKYDLDTEDFELTDYFSNKEPPYPFWYPPLFILCLPLSFLYLIIFLLLRPFGKDVWELVRPKVSFLMLPVLLLPKREIFTIAQLVSWSFTKNFIKRDDPFKT